MVTVAKRVPNRTRSATRRLARLPNPLPRERLPDPCREAQLAERDVDGPRVAQTPSYKDVPARRCRFAYLVALAQEPNRDSGPSLERAVAAQVNLRPRVAERPQGGGNLRVDSLQPGDVLWRNLDSRDGAMVADPNLAEAASPDLVLCRLDTPEQVDGDGRAVRDAGGEARVA